MASAAKAWLRALELTGSIPRNPRRTLPVLIEEAAQRFGDTPALLSDAEQLSYGALDARANRYARWALAQGLGKGDTVCLLMGSRPEYVAIWLGLIRAGCVVALLNSNLAGASLAHCVAEAAPRAIIAAAELVGALAETRTDARIWVHGSHGPQRHGRIDEEVERHAPDAPSVPDQTIGDPALLIYTSGTTGWPKAARVSHGRILQWSLWFAGMMDANRADRLYNVLPLYHSVGGIVALGAMFAGGGSVVIRERFSASRFWDDVVRWDCTLFQYIGELCRYLLRAPAVPRETPHRLRMACGNGLRADIWSAFQERFRIPRIFEFYASTEGNVSLFNIEGTPGAIGRIPPYLAHRFPTSLIKLDQQTGAPLRDAQGMCIVCAAGEAGEAVGRIATNASDIAGRFEGYTRRDATEAKLLSDVAQRGDVWFRTGDLMRKDGHGYFYFVDRLGDTFRWKGENVSTSEVAAALCAFPGVKDACVYGVAVPGADGRAGMAALVADGELDLSALRRHLSAALPRYALPIFLRMCSAVEVTGTFKHAKQEFARQGFDPAASSDPVYFDDGDADTYMRMDAAACARIQASELRF